MSQRTVITGGTLITGNEELRADLVIDDQQIVALLDDADGVDTDGQIDATDLLVLPGGLDPYGPAPEPTSGARSVADQRAAAAGGTTSIIADLDTTLSDEGAHQNQAVDFAYWSPIAGGNLPDAEQLSRMSQTGIVGFSATMRATGKRTNTLSDAELLTLMTSTARLNLPISLTALHPGLKLSNPLTEVAAVGTALLFAEHTGAWVHLRSLTTAAALHQVAESRLRGARVTASIPALHLSLAANDATRLLRPVPPLRSQAMIDDLWPFVLDETVDCITSTMIDRKGRDGAATCDTQTVLSLFWNEAVTKHSMSPVQATRMLSTNAAQITGLHPKKGAIRIGSDADLVLFDPKGVWTVRSRDMLNEDTWSPLDDRELTGFVVRTIRRGTTIYDADRHDDTKLLAEGSGALLART